MEKGVFVVANMEEESKKLQALLEADPELKKLDEEWQHEYEFRRKLIQARKEADMSPKVIGMMSGLNQRAIGRVEANSDVSPNLRTIVKYLNAIGYRLDIVKSNGNNLLSVDAE